MALDDRYANKFAPLDITVIYPKPGHKLLYTPITGEMKCPIVIHLPCAFHSIFSNVDATHAPIISQMIWSTSYHHVTLLVHQFDLTCFSPLPSSIAAKSCSSFTATRSIAPKPPTCPSLLQLVHQTKSCLDLLPLSHDSMSCLICNELLHHMCEPCNKSKPSHLHGIGCSHMMYLWTNHLCNSHLNTLVHTQLPKPNKDLLISPFW